MSISGWALICNVCSPHHACVYMSMGRGGGGGGKCGLVPISTCGPWISLLYKCRLGMEGGEYIGIKACFFLTFILFRMMCVRSQIEFF